MVNIERIWECLSAPSNWNKVKLLYVREDGLHFSVEGCPNRVFALRRLDWCDGWVADVRCDIPNGKAQRLTGYAGDSRRSFTDQMATLRAAINGVLAAVRTDYSTLLNKEVEV